MNMEMLVFGEGEGVLEVFNTVQLQVEIIIYLLDQLSPLGTIVV